MKNPHDIPEDTFEVMPKRKPRSLPNRHRFATCSGKMTFDKKGAEYARGACLKRGEPYIRIYRCPTCRRWHLTSKKRRP